MTYTKPFIHLFKTRNRNYMYDVNKNMILELDPHTYDKLKNMENNEQIEKLKSLGFLSANRAKVIEHPALEYVDERLKNGMGSITLQVTQQCNLHCEYCAYSGGYENRSHKNTKMSFELAKRGIDFLFDHSQNVETVSIGFYGGEPLLAFDLVKQCIHYAEDRGEGKELFFNITTNGTLLNPEKVAFLAAHDVHLMISMDGPKFMHDKHRKFAGKKNKGSFSKIMDALHMIRDQFPEYEKNIKLSVVLDPSRDFSCINEFFVNYELIKDLDLFPTIINDKYTKTPLQISDQYLIDTKYELFKVYLSRLNRLDSTHISRILNEYVFKLSQDLWEKRKNTISLAAKEHHSGPCIPGVQRFFVDVNGRFFPCERVSEASQAMIIGNIDDGFDTGKIKSLLNVGKLTEESCKNCWAFRYCDQCAAHADNLTELSAKKKAGYCSNSRLSTEERFKDYCTLKEFGYDFDT